MPQSALWKSATVNALTEPAHHYREGAARLKLGSGFFRQESRPARDLSVLLARHQAVNHAENRALHWLDLMAGCGIRALRWGLEASDGCPLLPDITVNDGDPDRFSLLGDNLAALSELGLQPRLRHDAAEQLLLKSRLNGERFDLIDLDAFGTPAPLIQPVLQVLRYGGILLLASTDGRSPTGHDRRGAIRSFGAAARVHPASWELALRHLLGLVVRQAWMLGYGIKPLLAFSEGRTFRLAVRLLRHPAEENEWALGLLARCEACGAQEEQSLIRLRDWPSCDCDDGLAQWMVHGPLWLGPLQDVDVIRALKDLQGLMAPATQRLLARLEADHGSPARVWSTAELSRRLGLGGPPAVAALVNALRASGHQACCSAVMAGQVRTDADLSKVLQLCREIRAEGT